MYNRYIPQSDGSYRKDKIPEQKPSPPVEAVPPAPAAIPASPGTSPVGGFLRRLLPVEFDTGDLLVVLLLLLMAEKGQEEKQHALLTLALYFLM